MTQDWDIKPRSEACSTCKTAFVDRAPYFSCLVFGAEGYARQDYCEPCWAKHSQGEGARYSVWQGIFRSPPPPAEEALKKETAESLLRKLIEEQDPARQEVIFILAVMLERKKILVERDVQVQDGVTTRVYEHKQSGETFVIRDPRLDLGALGAVQAQVVALLGGGGKKGAGEEPGTQGSGEAKTAEDDEKAVAERDEGADAADEEDAAEPDDDDSEEAEDEYDDEDDEDDDEDADDEKDE